MLIQREKRTLSFVNLSKSIKTLFLLILIIFSNFIVANEFKNFLASQKTENKITANHKEDLHYKLTSIVNKPKALHKNEILAGLRRTMAANVAFIQKTSKTKLKNLTNNHLTLNSKAKIQIQNQMQAIKSVMKTIKNEIKNNKDLPSVSPSGKSDLSYFEKRHNETEITTDDFSTNLRLSKEQLGRYTWAVLHSMASSFPLIADQAHQNAIKSFIENM